MNSTLQKIRYKKESSILNNVNDDRIKNIKIRAPELIFITFDVIY